MKRPREVVVDVSSTVRRPGITAARVRALVRATLAAEGVSDALISVALVGTRAITSLNRDYLRRSGPTDVIAFGMRRESRAAPAIGDIYIAPEVAMRNARRLRIPAAQELARLVVHGTLHVAGHDHPEGEERTRSAMWRLQERILAARD